MKKIRIYTLFVVIIISCVQTWGNTEKISLTPFPLANQLPSNSVQRIFQDKEGFMWFGSMDGLCRYDGYRIKIFRSGVTTPTLLSNNNITSLAEDGEGHIFIGTKKGVNILNKKDYRITLFPNHEIATHETRNILVDSEGYIWIGTASHVYRYDSTFTHYKRYDDSLPITSINSIYEDQSGNIWVSLWGKGLYRFDKGNNTFVKYPPLGQQDNIFKVFQDKRGQYWLCTWSNGVYLFYPDKTTSEMYVPFEIRDPERQQVENNFYSVIQDDVYEYIWFMCASGLYAFDYTDTRFRQIPLSQLFHKTNNIFSEIMKDRNGNLWVASFGEGVVTINFDKPIIQNYELLSIKKQTGISPHITTLCEDRQGNIWMNQNRRGLTIFNPFTGDTRLFGEYSELKDIPALQTVRCIGDFTSLHGEIWLGPESEKAIHCVEIRGNTIKLLRSIPLEANPRYFLEDSRGNIWIITEKGIYQNPAGSKEMVAIDLTMPGIISLTEDKEGNIWLVNRNSGIFIMPVEEPENIHPFVPEKGWEKEAGITPDNIETIFGDQKGQVWFGTKEGYLRIYLPGTRVFKSLPETLKIPDEAILNITDDNYGHIWISTNKRVMQYNPENESLIDYSGNDGVLVNSFFQNSIYKNREGKIFYGGNKGISVFTPSLSTIENTPNPKAYITDIKINSESVFQDNKNNKFNIKEQILYLEPDDKNVEIDFSSFNYTFHNKIQYAYKLDGIDDKWIYTGNDRQYAFYNKIKKGKHSFYLMATDHNRLWSNQITKLTIYKRPDFYETWWAYLIYLFTFSVILWFFYKRTQNRINLRNELRITQIEKEKTEELTQAKLRYFTNISHDLLTPLTIITCLIDDAEITYKNKIPQFDQIRHNVDRLKRLLQQILDFRKVENGKMVLKLSQGDMVRFLHEVCYTNFKPLMRKKNIDFIFTSSSSHIPACFDGDKIDKILYNLLSNAFKNTPENGRVELRVEETGLNGISYVRIQVTDTGRGIAQDELSKIFSRFYTNSITQATESNGIGLSLTKDLIEIHHGKIEVESEPEKGSVFTVYIPPDRESYKENIQEKKEITLYEKDIDLMSLPDENEVVMNDENISLLTDISILIVEDNEDLLKLIKSILSKQYPVYTAKNGKDALAVLSDQEIDIIVSDVMMPEMDGLEFCRQIKNDINYSHIPVILLTARNSTEDRIECYNAGADGYITKPFELNVLKARINNFIRTKKDKQEEFRTGLTVHLPDINYSSHDEKLLQDAIRLVEENLAEPDFDMNGLIEELRISKSSLYRKLKSMTGLSPTEFIRNIRLKRAAVLLTNPTISISEVAYATGFANPKYFSTCFREEFDMTPTEYQRSKNESV